MTSLPQAVWVPLVVSPQRHATRQRRRRMAAQLMLRSSIRDSLAGPDETTAPRVPRPRSATA